VRSCLESLFESFDSRFDEYFGFEMRDFWIYRWAEFLDPRVHRLVIINANAAQARRNDAPALRAEKEANIDYDEPIPFSDDEE
jgi:hypothetical protein